ncbi:RNA polymerase sigma factor [Plantactinospora sp. CA-290183]|uniref:RNA polymerase sigma factor n=1 Tax=Plantactinospora sp. CA-290183 TaxID=3240006 RepID=UPI003D9476FE
MADEDGHEARLAADRKLWGMVAAEHFAGRSWSRLVDVIVAAAVMQMRRDLRTKQIFRHCARRGWLLHAPDCWAHADQDGMVQETIAKALEVFVRRCRAGEGWDPDRASTLHDYFLGLCRGEFANIFRRWLTSGSRHEVELPSDDAGAAALRSEQDPARSALAKVVLDKIKDTDVLSDLQRKLLFGHAYGLTYDQLAQQFGTSAKAVEGQIHRARRQLRKEGITW